MSDSFLEDTKIKKSNTFIRASFKMTVLEQKIILLCISRIKENARKTNKSDNINLSFNFLAKEVVDFLKSNSKTIYTELNNIANRLMTYRIYINDGAGFKCIAPIKFCEYKNKIFTLQFAKCMQDYLLELDNDFTVYDVKNIIDLKHSNSIHIYEILKSYENSKRCNFDLIDFKDTLGFIQRDSKGNIVNNIYKSYAELKRVVLLPVQDELAKKTDIKFDFEEMKIGTKVTGLKFTIYKNSRILNKSDSKVIKLDEFKKNNVNVDALVEQLQEFIVEPLKIKDLKAILRAANNDVKLVQSKYELAKYQSKINNLVAWLISAIKHDYTVVNLQKGNKFINYEQDTWDFDELEKLERQLINNKLEDDFKD